MKFASVHLMIIAKIGGIQQAGAPETVAKSVIPCFTCG